MQGIARLAQGRGGGVERASGGAVRSRRGGSCPGEWPGFAQAASANAGSATGAASAGSDSCPRLTHCWVSHALQS